MLLDQMASQPAFHAADRFRSDRSAIVPEEAVFLPGDGVVSRSPPAEQQSTLGRFLNSRASPRPCVDFHPELSRVWSEPHGLDHMAPFELSRFLGKQGFEFLGGSVAEG